MARFSSKELRERYARYQEQLPPDDERDLASVFLEIEHRLAILEARMDESEARETGRKGQARARIE